MWEHYECFITRMMPISESVGLKMRLHPSDPPISPIAGRSYLFTDVSVLQRALELVPSPSSGLLFCQGCFTEMLGEGVSDAIRHFGRQVRVFYVHFRSVVGMLPKFRGAFIDNGDIEMLKAMKVWKETGSSGPMIPDHYPRIVADSEEAHWAWLKPLGT